MTPHIEALHRAGRTWLSATLLAAAVPLLAASPSHAGVGTGTLALGDSAVGLLSSLPQRDTFALALTGGDTVDVGVFSRTEAWIQPGLTLLDDQGAAVGVRRVTRPGYRPGGAAEIIVAVPVPHTGTYRLIVRDATPAPNEFHGCPCRYAVYSRRAGPVLEATGSEVNRTIREGTATSPPDPEFRVYNRGSGSATFTVAFDTAVNWLVPSRTAGTAFAAPPGSSNPDPVVVRMTVSAALVPKGIRDGMISFVEPNDVWNGVDRFRALLYVYDGRLAVIDSTLYTQVSSLALAPDGTLAIASNGTIYRMNPTTGAYSPWATGVGQYIGSMAFGPDGALYVADRVTNRVLRVSPAGVVSTLFATAEAPLDLEVLPDGTLFATAGRLILRRSPQGALTTLLTRPFGGGTSISLAYMDGWLYYMDLATAELGRVNPFTGADERRGTLPFSLNPDLEAGQSGRLYVNDISGGLTVLDDAGHVVDRVYTPWTPSFALGDGVLYGTGSPYQTWKLPLADRPAVAHVVVGDASGDGQITSADALAVLSYLVGKPVPAGWNLQLGGDADCDGEVTAVDALVILSRVVGKDVSRFCVGALR